MLRKLFILTLIFTLTCIFTYAQDEENLKSKEKEAARAYTFAFGGGGSYLGIQTSEVTKENFAKFGLSEVRGVAVEKVVKDSPAEKADLQDGDVIIRFNGETVTSTRKLTRLISEVAPDHKANITVVRNGGERDLTVTVGKRNSAVFLNSGTIIKDLFPVPAVPDLPASPNVPRVWNSPVPSRDGVDVFTFFSNYSIGIGVSSLTKQLGDYFGVEEGKGVPINKVNENSPAERAGLKAGDIIVEIDGQEITSTFDLTRRINEQKEGAVNLTIIRNKNRQIISVTPEKRKGSALNVEELEKIKTRLKTQSVPGTRVITSPRVMTYSPSTRIL